MNRKLRIYNHAWHLGHQHSLISALKDYADFYWQIQFKRPFSKGPRGDFPVNLVTHYEPGFYDLAILHLDNQCLDPDIWERGKGSMYRVLNELITDIPKIVINHGTPYFPEKYPPDLFNDEFAKYGISSKLIAEMKKVVGNNVMVVNSRTAAKQWDAGIPIIHGLKPEQWWDLPKEPRVVSMISPAGLDMYYDRQFLQATKEVLESEENISLCHITVDWQSKDWDDYRNFIGRSLVFFNPTRESPMPRSRTEAMLSGCCVITTPSQDASDFIEDGVNGFICRRDPEHVKQLVKWCFTHYDEALAIGQRGKETAIKLFTEDRYRQDWLNLLEKVLGRKLEAIK